jgi:hypothetical protein
MHAQVRFTAPVNAVEGHREALVGAQQRIAADEVGHR